MFWSFVGRILIARWLVVAIVTLGSLAGGAVVLATATPEYDATARVLLNIHKPDVITGSRIGKRAIDPYMQTQVNIVRDLGVVGPAVEAVGWLDDPDIVAAYNDRPAGDPRPLAIWVAHSVMSKLTVRIVDDSNIIEIRYRGETPELAGLVAGAIRDAYIAATIRERRDGAMADADAQAVRIERVRSELAALEAQKRTLEAQSGVLLEPNGFDIDGMRLRALSEPPRPGAPPPEPIVTRPGSYTNSLAQLDLELAQATRTLGPRHPKLLELRAARDRMATLLRLEESAAGSAAAIVVGRERAKQAELDAQRSKVLSQRQDVLRLRLLQDQINLKAKALEAGTRQIANLRTLSTVIESGLTPVGEVQSEPKPAFPNAALMLGGTGGIGFVAGILAALLFEMLNLRVRTLSGLRIATELPVLGTVPPLNAKARAKTVRKFALRRLKPAAA